MDYKSLESEITNIVQIVEKVPDKYKEKTYEILLNKILESDNELEHKKKDEKFVVPIDIKALFKKHDIDLEKLSQLFLMEDGKIESLYELPEANKSTTQNQIGLLTALENSLIDDEGKIEFDTEEVRKKCKEKKCYDESNFKANFRNSGFFDIDDPQHVKLIPEGKEELAKLIKEITT